MAEPLAASADFELATELGLAPERVDQLLRQASAAVRAFCGWTISAETGAVFTLDGTGSRLLTLPTLRLTGVTSVTVDGVAADPADFGWSENGVVESLSGTWGTSRRGVTVVADHGYDTVPEEVGAVVLSMAARAAASPLGETRTQTGPFSVAYSTTGPGVSGGVVLLDHERWALGPYRVPR